MPLTKKKKGDSYKKTAGKDLHKTPEQERTQEEGTDKPPTQSVRETVVIPETQTLYRFYTLYPKPPNTLGIPVRLLTYNG